MGYAKWMPAAIAAGALAAASPAAAQSDVEAGTKIRQLDMMLMVTALRCRFGTDDFRPAYEAFKVRYKGELAAAATRVLDDMTRRMGRARAIDAYDRMSTGMANSYGQGHPWMGCAALKQAASDLAGQRGQAPLLAAADNLLGEQPNGTLLARR